jgi:hypothetical protein
MNTKASQGSNIAKKEFGIYVYTPLKYAYSTYTVVSK